jgi:hypothetical protein
MPDHVTPIRPEREQKVMTAMETLRNVLGDVAEVIGALPHSDDNGLEHQARICARLAEETHEAGQLLLDAVKP